MVDDAASDDAGVDPEPAAGGVEPAEDDGPTTGNSEAIARAFADGPAYIPYLAVGDPDYESSLEYVEALERGGADLIELGLPFSEPIAEGPTIQGAVVRALEGGMTPDRFFEFVEELDVDVPLVCMTYYNLIYQWGEASGPRPFVERAAEAGLEGFVVPDLPAEEADPLRDACDEFGLDLVFIVAPTTEGDRLDRIMSRVSGYVYVQARLGTTGAQDDVSDRTAASLDRLREYDVPKAVGFGISAGEHAERIVAAGADGIIVGSALVDIVAEGAEADRSAETVADRLEALSRELVEGADRGYRARSPTADSR
ncbi:tryptophan synthase subunit alpha [Halopenitus persicus]|uniref:Tryptophan synthase alpha chain n=1 Tax=Halopenitus persicus TaxID=1048396 RepID=A0A1H3G9C2_9EURY|nr:tryptophan synthase subunit alpha [Halopenitus persicus]QHS16944.1 tryptophan synthase subunit alpha [haloarchaeon 3A1-DGR]SDX99861.1 tryptophan synthase, alpha chain [Halopenitus persicus]